MSRQSWHLFEGRRPRAHLVVAVINAETGPGPRHAQLVLERLVRQQQPIGDYATTVVRENGGPEVFLGFQEEGDARTLGEALQAAETGSLRGWMTRRIAQLDRAVIAAIVASLPAPRVRPKETSEELNRRPRIRGSSRAPIVRLD
jgi:hypothetical protein